MPYPVPDPRNFTRPGGIAIYVDDGTGMAHLGNTDISKMSGGNKPGELEITSQLSGEERIADVFIISRPETYKLSLQEITPENLQRYLLGGTITPVDPGTAAVTDQKATLTGALLASLGQYGISAVTVRQFLDQVLVYDGAAYTDNTTEADALDGTAFDTLIDGGDFLYLGKATKFKEIYIDFAVPGSYGAVVWEYWDGSAWQTLSVSGAANALAADGKANWTLPADWATKIVNSSAALYWVRVSATTPWTTPATINEIRQNAVQNTDYIVDPGQVTGGLLPGRVGRLTGGFLADGEEVMVSYTKTTWTAFTFPVNTAQYTRYAARIDMMTNKGTQMRRHIPACYVKPAGEITFDGKGWLQLPVELQVLDDYTNNPTAPVGTAEILY